MARRLCPDLFSVSLRLAHELLLRRAWGTAIARGGAKRYDERTTQCDATTRTSDGLYARELLEGENSCASLASNNKYNHATESDKKLRQTR